MHPDPDLLRADTHVTTPGSDLLFPSLRGAAGGTPAEPDDDPAVLTLTQRRRVPESAARDGAQVEPGRHGVGVEGRQPL
jgi:hypothetical protein